MTGYKSSKNQVKRLRARYARTALHGRGGEAAYRSRRARRAHLAATEAARFVLSLSR